LIHLEQGLTQDSQSLNLRVSIRRGKRCCDWDCFWSYFWVYFWGCFWGYARLGIIKTALGRADMGR
jgi:hypothetical protein